MLKPVSSELNNSKVLVEDKFKYSNNKKWEIDIDE